MLYNSYYFDRPQSETPVKATVKPRHKNTRFFTPVISLYHRTLHKDPTIAGPDAAIGKITDWGRTLLALK